MADGKEEVIDKYIDRTGFKSDTQFALLELNELFKAFQKLNEVKLSLGKSLGLKDLTVLTKQTTLELERMTKANDGLATSAKAAAKAMEKQKEAERPYKQLSLAFAAAAKNAQDLGAKYGTMDKRAQAAAKTANELNNKLKEIDRSIGNHQRNVGNYGSALDNAGAKIKGFALNFLSLIGIAGAGSIFSSAIDEFIQMDKNVRLLQNTLKNVGVPEAFARIELSAKKLATQFTFLDDDDILNVFNKLIVYGKLTEQQMNDLLPVIIDFSVATGQDLTTATGTVIKALEGNGKALKEFGINMKDAKNVTEGFDLIMKDLKPRVEGVAQAFGDSSAGGLASAKQEFANLKEEIGEGLLPVLNSVLSVLLKIGQGVFGAAKGLKEFFSGGSFVGSIVESSLGGDEAAQAAISKDVAANESFVDARISELKKLQAQGKKLNVTENDVRQEYLNSLIKQNKAREATIKAVKDTNNIQDIKEVLVQFTATQQTIAKLQGQLSKKTVLGLGGGSDGKKGSQDSVLKAQFELLKANLEIQIDAQKDIFENERNSYEQRLQAIVKYVELKKKLIESEAEFEKSKKDVTSKEIEAIDAKSKKALIDLQRETSKTINDIEIKAIEQRQKKLDELQKSIDDGYQMMKQVSDEVADKQISDAVKVLNERIKAHEIEKKLIEERRELYKQLYSEVLNAVETIISGGFEKEKNKLQEQSDAIDARTQKEIDLADQTITNEEEKAARIAVIEAKAQSQKDAIAKRQRDVDIKKAQFDKAASALEITLNTAQAIAKIKTQLAIYTALASNPITGPLYAPAVAITASMIPITLATGAAQIAAVLATKIPKYREGTKDHPGGLAVVGDGGKSELVVTPQGELFKTPDTSTLVDIPKHSIVLPDIDKAFQMSVNRTGDLVTNHTAAPQFNFESLTEEIKGVRSEIKTTTRAIKSKTENHWHQASDGRWKMFMQQNGNSFIEYLNSHL